MLNIFRLQKKKKLKKKKKKTKERKGPGINVRRSSAFGLIGQTHELSLVYIYKQFKGQMTCCCPLFF
jgi:hypothetical protein